MAVPKKKLLIVADDHPRVREALEHIINELHDCTTLYTALEPQELVSLAERRLGDASELTMADVSLGARPAAPAGAGKPLMVVATQERGITANWFVAIDDKQNDGQTGSRIEAALGQRDAVLELIQSLRSAAADQDGAAPEPMRDLPDVADLMRLGLTLRQSEVLLLLAEGLTNKEIARKLDVSEWTVRHHVSSILERLEVSNRGRAAIFARKLGPPAT